MIIHTYSLSLSTPNNYYYYYIPHHIIIISYNMTFGKNYASNYHRITPSSDVTIPPPTTPTRQLHNTVCIAPHGKTKEVCI